MENNNETIRSREDIIDLLECIANETIPEYKDDAMVAKALLEYKSSAMKNPVAEDLYYRGCNRFIDKVNAKMMRNIFPDVCKAFVKMVEERSGEVRNG